MSEITRLPTKFGPGHSEAIGYFQDEILPRLIDNKIVVLVLRGITDGGDELHYTMFDSTGERQWNLRLLGQLTEAQIDLVEELAE